MGKLIIDAVVAAQGVTLELGWNLFHNRLIQYILLELGLVVGIGLVDRILGYLRQRIAAKVGSDLRATIMEKAQSLNLRDFENPTFFDMLNRARREASSRPLSLVQYHFQIMRAFLTLAGFTIVLLNFNKLATIWLLISGVPAFISEIYFSGLTFRLSNQRAAARRQLNYLENVVTSQENIKDVKLLKLGSMLIERFKKLTLELYNQDQKLLLQSSVWSFSLTLITTASYYCCYILVAMATVSGRISLGLMTLYAVAFRRCQGAFQDIFSALGGMYTDNLYMSNLFDFLAISASRTKPLRLAAVRKENGIRFEGVGFRYADSKEWSLRRISFFIPEGDSVALVGKNGAGKSTIIKLLTGLYEPTEGVILLDGIDLRQWTEAELHQRIGVIFQDFSKFQFSFRENVGFGDLEYLTDQARITRAIDLGGASELAATLPAGLETQLGREFESGVELSGGQWQQVALSRAFMREDADIFVLDEPTAALDPMVEYAVFERFRSLAHGRTTVLISHRFPIARMADRIIVIDHGYIVEQGTHTELLAANGCYAQLFALQASGYR